LNKGKSKNHPKGGFLLNNTINYLQNQNFSCNITDWQLKNLTLQIWKSGELYYNETKEVSGSENQSEFNVSMDFGNYEWNCLGFDENGTNCRSTTIYNVELADEPIYLSEIEVVEDKLISIAIRQYFKIIEIKNLWVEIIKKLLGKY
jgi:hypothetical protein